MATVRKFTFDRDFDEVELSLSVDGDGHPGTDADLMLDEAPPQDDEQEPEEIEEPAPTYTEEDLEIAREEAYVEGHAAALAEVTATTQRAIADALQACSGALMDLRPTIESAQGELTELAARVAVEVCRKMLPHTADRHALEEVQGFVSQLLPSLAAQPRISVKVHPDVAEGLHPLLQQAAQDSGFEGRIVILADRALGIADVRAEWADGGAERNTTRLWREVDALIERNLPRFGPDDAVELPDDTAEAAADTESAAGEPLPVETEDPSTPPSRG